jgi:uncharacterized protein (DUF924 family)
MKSEWQAILDFWFLPADAAGHGASRTAWFKKDPAFDAQIRERFGTLIGQALAAGLQHWDRSAQGALARILLLDQFTRNTLRDTPQAFGGDALALSSAQRMVAAGTDRLLLPVQRYFVYMPFMHAEDLALQQRSLVLFRQLHAETGDFAGALDYAMRHHDIVARFGRFPHRNQILGRASTAEELAFLSLPGSGF